MLVANTLIIKVKLNAPYEYYNAYHNFLNKFLYVR